VYPPEGPSLVKVLLFGATGTAGGAVLRACLSTAMVDEVRAVTRHPLTHTDATMRTYLHDDYTSFETVMDAFVGVDACLYCLGISVTKVDPEAYRRISYDFPLAAAQALQVYSPGAAFHYISGAGTSKNSRMRWARVKAATEDELISVYKAVCWRPAFIDAPQSATAPRGHRILGPIVRILKPFSKLYVEGTDLGFAMLQAVREGVRGRVIENPLIRELARRCRSHSKRCTASSRLPLPAFSAANV
jgi:hypothetical protein